MPATSNDLTLREASASERAVCADILTRAWNSALPAHPRQVGLDEFEEQTQGELLIVATRRGEPVGFIAVWEPSWFVHHLFVDPAFQRRGIGGRLLEHVATLAAGRALSLKCQSENRAAIRFYEKHGFRRSSLRGSDEFGEWVEFRARIVR